MEKIEAPKNLPEKIRIKFKSGFASGNDVLFVEGLGKSYPGKPLLKRKIQHQKKRKSIHSRSNGCGKSTF